MAHRRSRRHRRTLRALAVFLASAALLALTPLLLPAEDVLRLDLTKNDTAPIIQITADEMLAWTEGGTQVLLLRGNVYVAQGGTQVRMQEGVAFIDEAGRQKTGVYVIDLYGEPDFQIQLDGKPTVPALQGLVRLATRGDIVTRTPPGKSQKSPPQVNNSVYRRAGAIRQSPAPPLAALPSPATPLAPPPPTIPLVRVSSAAPAPATPQPIVPPPVTPLSPAPVIVPAGGPVPLAPVVQTSARSAPIGEAPGVAPVAPIQAVQPPSPPPPPPTPPVTLAPPGSPKPAPASSGGALPRNVTIWPRSYGEKFGLSSKPLENGETVWIANTGVIVRISNPGTKKGVMDIEGDRVVIWTKDKKEGVGERMATPAGETTNQVEFYIAGHVEMRYESQKGETEKLSADEVYYDTSRNVAIAIQADMELRDPKLPYPSHMKTPELQQLNAKKYITKQSEMYSTILPSDPGLEIWVRKGQLVEVQEIKKNIFGYPQTDPKTGEPLVTNERYFTGRDMVIFLEGVPVFYWPYYYANIAEPLGPLKAISANYNSIFGFQMLTTWDMFSVLGMRKPDGVTWRLYLDYMSARGPAAGTEYDWSGSSFFGLPGKFDNVSKVYGILDSKPNDVVGSGGTSAFVTPFTTVPLTHPYDRGRLYEQFNAQALPDGFSFQAKASLLSDRNFMEQYYQWEYLNGLNQETFAYLKQQQQNWAWTVLAEPRVLDWFTRTQWLPKVDGYWFGESLFDRAVYNVKGGVAYAELRTTDQPPFAYEPTDFNDNTGRAHVWQDVSVPMQLGAFKVMPFLVSDVAYYSSDINGSPEGRLWGGGGVNASVPLSKLYPEVQSDLFNLNGIFHKIVISGLYENVGSNVPHTDLPQLDRLNDDVSDFTLRNMHEHYPTLFPGPLGQYLYGGPNGNPLFDPQNFAMRKLVDTSIDTLDSMEVLTFDVRQRWQTKRGFPGAEHIVDWMTLDVSTWLYPDSHRDDFGHTLGFVDYDWKWNVGDRTQLFSTGWFEPFQQNGEPGARVWAVGTTINRWDSTNIMLSYRQLDPIGSKAVLAQVMFPFSAKYALTLTTTWDFGDKETMYSLLLTRKGTDVLVGIGISYNSYLNNVGFTFEIVPNLLLSRMRTGIPGQTGSALGGTNSSVMGTGR